MCEGSGMRVIEMNFLPDVYVDCENCLGRRYNRETLEVLYKGKSINDVLNMTVSEGVEFFQHIPPIFRKLRTLNENHHRLHHAGATGKNTLSGGEAQRVKLARTFQKTHWKNAVHLR